MKKYLKNIYAYLNKKSSLLIILLIIILLLNLNRIKAILFSVIFILLSSVSKIYHRFFKSTIGIDLVLFFSIMISLVYKNILLALLTSWIGLMLADIIGTRLSHTSLISIIGLTIIIILSKFFIYSLSSLIILTIIYEIIVIVFYYLMGSSIDKIAIFLVSHFLFNMLMITGVAEPLKTIM